MEDSVKKPRKPKKRRKAFFTKQFYVWHWVSGAISLASMLLFAVTGITLNHAGDIKSKPKVVTVEVNLPEDIKSSLQYEDGEEDEEKPLPKGVAVFVSKKIGLPLKSKIGEWSEFEIYFELARPGADAWLLIDRESGEVTYEKTSRGVISYINDLHQGRNTGVTWSWYMDVFSVACIIFTITGLMLLFVHAKRRPSTWPIVAAGIVLPIIIVVFLIH